MIYDMVKMQDILVLLKVAGATRAVRQADVARLLGLSQAEVNNTLKRAGHAGFLVAAPSQSPLTPDRVRRAALLEYLVHGLKYACPGHMTDATRGMPTAWGTEVGQEGMLQTSAASPVWPCAEGTARGPGLNPIYPTVPYAAAHDSQLYDLLALVDVIRIGRVRDRTLAGANLKRRLCP